MANVTFSSPSMKKDVTVYATAGDTQGQGTIVTDDIAGSGDRAVAAAIERAHQMAVQDALAYLAMPPGWSPDGKGQTTADLRNACALDTRHAPAGR